MALLYKNRRVREDGVFFGGWREDLWGFGSMSVAGLRLIECLCVMCMLEYGIREIQRWGILQTPGKCVGILYVRERFAWFDRLVY